MNHLPAYIHTATGRAFLTYCQDIHGNWNVGYTEWYDPTPEINLPTGNFGVYRIATPPLPVQDAPTLEAAKEQMEQAMGVVK